MPSHTPKERAKKTRKVASNGTKKPAKNGMGGRPLTDTKAGKKRKQKRAKMKREFS